MWRDRRQPQYTKQLSSGGQPAVGIHAFAVQHHQTVALHPRRYVDEWLGQEFLWLEIRLRRRGMMGVKKLVGNRTVPALLDRLIFGTGSPLVERDGNWDAGPLNSYGGASHLGSTAWYVTTVQAHNLEQAAEHQVAEAITADTALPQREDHLHVG